MGVFYENKPAGFGDCIDSGTFAYNRSIWIINDVGIDILLYYSK